MTSNKSKDFEDFYRSFFVEISDFNIDISDYAAAARLVGEEKQEAQRLLIEAIYSGKDHTVYSIGSYVKGLGELRSAGAIDFLQQLLPSATGCLRLYVAEAIWKTNQSDEAASIMVELLRPQSPAEFQSISSAFGDENCRFLTAIALRQLSDEASQSALLEALADESAHVRGHAAGSLIERYHCRTPASSKLHAFRTRWLLPPKEETEIVEGIRSLDLATRDRARERLIGLIKPVSVPERREPEFHVAFFPENSDYVIYWEGERELWFHLWRAKNDLSLFTKDSLSGPNGSQIELNGSDAFRIIPRIVWFLRGNDQYPHLREEPHPSETLAKMPNEFKKPFGWRGLD